VTSLAILIRDALPKSWQVPIKFWVNAAQQKLEPELGLLPYLVNRGDLALDIGANRGIYTYRLRRLDAVVLAFEPNPSCASLLRDWGKQDPAITVHNVALSNQTGEGILQIPIDSAGVEHDSSASLVTHQFHTSRSIPVSLRKLDSYMLTHISLIKIDVEGAEEDVLNGSTLTLESSKPALLIEIEQRHANRSILSTFDMLKSMGYVGFFIDKHLLRSVLEFDLSRDQCIKHLGVKRARYINNFLFLHQHRLDAGNYEHLFNRWGCR